MRRLVLVPLLLVLAACTSTATNSGTATNSVTVTVGATGTSSATLESTRPSLSRSPATTRTTTTTTTVGRTAPTQTAPTLTPSTRTAPTRIPTPQTPTNPPTAISPSATTPPTCAQVLANLSRPQRIGQLLMIGVPLDDPESGLAALGARPVGGVFLSGHYDGSASRISDGIEAIQQRELSISGVRLHVSVDQEGGQVQSLTGPEFTEIATAVQQGTVPTGDLTAQTSTWAHELKAVGVTLDLAPVADTVPAGTEQDNPPIGRFDRQYGSTPGSVSTSITTVVTAMQGAGLGATIKHFPGLGRVTVNTDTSADAIDDQTSTSSSYLDPFKAGIKAGATAVMISSARYTEIDPNNIAAFSSKIITGLLRGQLGFRGLVISDDFGAAVAVSDFSAGERAVKFIDAGGDMVLTVDAADLQPMTDALTKAANDPGFRAKVDAAALRVIVSKKLC